MKTILTSACLALWCGASLAQATLEVNQARELDLDGLKGLGPATTRQILTERQRQAFKDWPDLMRRISGVGPKKAAQLSEQGLQVNGQSYPPVQPKNSPR